MAHLSDLTDLQTPWCIHTAATLHIADHIAAGIDHIQDLAAAAGCDAVVLHSLLGYLVSKGVFEEPEPGRFALNEVSQGFLDPGMRLGLDLEGIGGRMAYAWGTLPTYVRTGEPGYRDLFGLPFWEDLDAHPQVKDSFDALMGAVGHGTPNPNFQIKGGWDAVRTIVDVGGGTGGMLAEILKAHPHLRGTLLDRPGTVALSPEIFRRAGVGGRATAVAGSFFDPLPAGADIYLLKSVLNDWPDREADEILRRCAEAARPNGRVVLLSGVMPDDSPRTLLIEMVLCGGKQRTVTEFKQLAHQAGLEMTAGEQQPLGYFVVECRPT